MDKPLAIDLYCGLGGWAEGFLAEGYDVIGFDIEQRPYPASLCLQDVTTLHGSQFKDAAVIVASPPCQEYSYMAMPWSRAKAIAAEYRSGARDVKKLTALFDACFRIQREAIEAAGRFIPLIVENVRGAQEWVGGARWHHGSYYLWGDIPALMPITTQRPRKNDGGSWFNIANNTTSGVGNNPDGRKVPSFRFDGSKRSFQQSAVEHLKTVGHVNQRDGHSHARHLTNQDESDKLKESGVKQPGISGVRDNGQGSSWFQNGASAVGSKSPSRKEAAALIAKIPFQLARHIAAVYKPTDVSS